MRTGAFFFGGVEMDDAGAGPPAPTDRRYDAATCWRALERMLDAGVAAEAAGLDSFWLTEHHFQHEGYEVVPNAVMFGAVLAERTRRLRIGAMFNIVPQWHPLKLAEDFATLHNLSGGRAILGIGRGTVPREAQTLGTAIGSHDNPDKVDADRLNREMFDEGVEIIRAALDNTTFAHDGAHWQLPPPGIPDRGGFVEHLTLVPRPLYPYEIWQAVTSPPTLEYVPRKGWGGVFWLQHRDFVRRHWERFAEIHATEHGRQLEPGENRMLVLNVRVESTHEAAWERARPGHDEFWKFLGPYGWSRGYMGPDGGPAPAGLIPTLEESVENGVWVIGTAEEVAAGVQSYKDALSLRDLVIFPNLPGDTYDESIEQMHRYMDGVEPLLS